MRTSILTAATDPGTGRLPRSATLAAAIALVLDGRPASRRGAGSRARGDHRDRAAARGEAPGRAGRDHRVQRERHRGAWHQHDARRAAVDSERHLRRIVHDRQQLRLGARRRADQQCGFADRHRRRRRSAEQPEAAPHGAVRHRAHRGAEGPAGRAVRPQRDRRRTQHRDRSGRRTNSRAGSRPATARATRRRSPVRSRVPLRPTRRCSGFPPPTRTRTARSTTSSSTRKSISTRRRTCAAA